MDVCSTIKRLVIARRVRFTAKAEGEMALDHLTPELVYEAVLNAPAIAKVLRSTNPHTGHTERLFIIKGMTFEGVSVYTKGKLLTHQGITVFYVLISSKRNTDF